MIWSWISLKYHKMNTLARLPVVLRWTSKIGKAHSRSVDSLTSPNIVQWYLCYSSGRFTRWYSPTQKECVEVWVIFFVCHAVRSGAAGYSSRMGGGWGGGASGEPDRVFSFLFSPFFSSIFLQLKQTGLIISPLYHITPLHKMDLFHFPPEHSTSIIK